MSLQNLVAGLRGPFFPTGEELEHLRKRRHDKAEEARTAGKWCLTPEGRVYVRQLWNREPEHWIITLLGEVERLERALAASESALASLTASESEEQRPTECPGKDPKCPCQDGDQCHYKDSATTKGWPVGAPPA